jgi:hypothetical protein
VEREEDTAMKVEIDRSGLRELDQRSGDGVRVTLLWSERTGGLFVCVDDDRGGNGFHFAVDGAHALDAFRHPYAYADRGAVDEAVPRATSGAR